MKTGCVIDSFKNKSNISSNLKYIHRLSLSVIYNLIGRKVLPILPIFRRNINEKELHFRGVSSNYYLFTVGLWAFYRGKKKGMFLKGFEVRGLFFFKYNPPYISERDDIMNPLKKCL